MKVDTLKFKMDVKNRKLWLVAIVASVTLLLSIFASTQFNVSNALAGLFSEPETEPAEYVTVEDFEKGHLDCYKQYEKAVDAGKSYYIVNELLGPACIAGGVHNGSQVTKAIDMFDPTLVDYDQNIMEQEWNAYLDSIGFINCYMKALNDSSYVLPENIKRCYLAESKTLRAMLYLDLYTMFGTVAITPPEYIQDLYTEKRPTKEEFFTYILDECKRAADTLAGLDVPIYHSTGFVNKYVAELVAAEAALFNKNRSSSDLNQAIYYLDDIIANGGKLVTDISGQGPNQIWAPIAALNSEYTEGHDVDALMRNYSYGPGGENIFAIQYGTDLSFADKNPWVNKLGVRSYSSSAAFPYFGSGEGMLSAASQVLAAMYKGEKSGSGSVGDRWNGYIAQYSENKSVSGDYNTNITGYSTDPNLQDQEKQARWRNIVNNSRGISCPEESPFGDYGNYYVGNGKYGPINFYDGTPANFNKQDYKKENLNEVYLLRAFADFNRGWYAEALNYLNDLRQRENAEPYRNIDENILINEFLFESIFTGNTYKYFLMMGQDSRFDQYLFGDNGLFKAQEGTTLDGETYKLGINFEKIKSGNIEYAYLPIPTEAIEMSGWEQNPGWVKP